MEENNNYQTTYEYQTQSGSDINVCGLISMICGILGVCCCSCCFCGYLVIPAMICVFLLGTAAIVLSIIGKKKKPEKKGMANAGLILGIVALVLALGIIVLYVLAIGGAVSLGVLSGIMNSMNYAP